MVLLAPGTPQPPGPGHPWWNLPNLLLTPHVAATMPVSVRRVIALAQAQAQAERIARGEPLLNVVAGGS